MTQSSQSGQTYLAIATWAPLDTRPGIGNGTCYIMIWMDDSASGNSSGLTLFQIIPTSSVDIAYAGWTPSQNEVVDSLDGLSHILAFVNPGTANGGSGYLCVYKYFYRIRNSLTGH